MPPAIALFIISTAINKLHSLRENSKEEIIQHEQSLKVIQDLLNTKHETPPS